MQRSMRKEPRVDADAEGFEMVAASLRADAADIPSYVEVLATKLEQALPLQTSVERRGRGFLSREKRVQRIQVQVGDEVFKLGFSGGGVETSRANAVRGIVLKTEPLPLEDWVSALSRKLAGEAQKSEQARLALQRLLSG
jgi:hypothetical protein